MKIIGYLKDIVGEFYAKDSFGRFRKIDTGNAIFEKEIVVDIKDLNHEIKDPFFVACRDTIDKYHFKDIEPKSYVIDENIIERSDENIFYDVFIGVKNNIIKVLNEYTEVFIVKKDFLPNEVDNLNVNILVKEPIIDKREIEDKVEKIIKNDENVDDIETSTPVIKIKVEDDDISIPVTYKVITDDDLEKLISIVNIDINRDDIPTPITYKIITEDDIDRLIPIVNIDIEDDILIEENIVKTPDIPEDIEEKVVEEVLKEEIVPELDTTEDIEDEIVEETPEEPEYVKEEIIPEVPEPEEEIVETPLIETETDKSDEDEVELLGYSSSVAFIQNGEQTAIIDDDNNFIGDFDLSDSVLFVTLEMPEEDYLFDDNLIDWDLSEENHRLTGFSNDNEILEINIDDDGSYQGDYNYSKEFSDMDINIRAEDVWGDFETSKINIIIDKEKEEIEDDEEDEDKPTIEEVFNDDETPSNDTSKSYNDISIEDSHYKTPLPILTEDNIL